MNVEFKFNNGDKVRERVTGFTGIITGAVSYITGCNQHLVTAKAKDENSEAKAQWYDDGRLELVEANSINKVEVQGDKDGADISAPIK